MRCHWIVLLHSKMTVCSPEAASSHVETASTFAGHPDFPPKSFASSRTTVSRVGLEGLGLDGGAIGRCRGLVLQLPGEAASALHRLRERLRPASGTLAPLLAAALDHLQVPELKSTEE